MIKYGVIVWSLYKEWRMRNMTRQKRKVLFLCSGNSCRSQMAEAIVNAQYGSHWEAFSAGIQPAGNVHPNAIKVLEEMGIMHKGTSKSADQFRGVDFDLVVTVCDDAAENCPVWLGKGERFHLSFPDPAKAVGNEEQVIEVFRTVRNAMVSQLMEIFKRTEY